MAAVAAGHREPGARGVRVDDVVGEAEPFEQLGDRAAAGGERLGADVERETVELDAADAPAERVAALEHRDPEADPGALERGHEPGDAAADHDDVGSCAVFARRGFSRHAAALLAGRATLRRQSTGSWGAASVTPAASCTSSTTRVSTVGSVSGGTPWPRFNTCAGARLPRASTSRTCGLEHGPRRGEQRGVDVALQRDVGADARATPRRAASASRRRPCRRRCRASRRAARRCRRRSARRGTARVRRARGIRRLVLEVVHVRERPRRRGRDVRLVVGERERARPRVEELRGGGPGEHLRAQERAR